MTGNECGSKNPKLYSLDKQIYDMDDISNVRLFAMALISSLLSLVIYGLIYEVYRPNDGGWWTLPIAIGVFSVLTFVDGFMTGGD